MIYKFIHIVLLIIFFIQLGISQDEDNTYIIISGFEIDGNKKTRKSTITRELDFEIGDTLQLSELANRLGKNQTLLLNTNLFLRVNMNVGNWDTETSKVVIQIKVKEAWYIYPVPIFELADRNFNVWWKQYNHSFKRVNYGSVLYYSNVTGRRDFLIAAVQLGYTQKYRLKYSSPSVNQAKTVGMNFDFLLARNKEIGLRTIDNDLDFYRSDNRFLLQRYRIVLGATYRPDLYEQHKIEARYNQRNIVDSVFILNPDFFLDGRSRQRFFTLSYTYSLDKRDFIIYPLTGFFIRAKLNKEGFGIFKDKRNSLCLTTTLAKYFQFGKKKKYSISLLTKSRIEAFRQKNPYYNNRALGFYDDFVRGYEYYVLDGLDYAYMKNSIRYEILNKNIDWKKAMPLKAFKKMPFRMYFSINSDLAYTNDPHYSDGNPLSNRLLWGGGVGLDFLIYVDKIIQVEYSINQLGEKGVYLHYRLFL